MTDVPLVLLNAFPLDKEQWEPLLAALDAPVGDIITFDPPGIGDMPATEEPPSLELIADAAVAAMREVTGTRAALWVGCSMGGYVAMTILERHADAVAGVGLIGTKASADTPEAAARRELVAREALTAGGAAQPDAMAHGMLGSLGRGEEALVAAVRANIARQGGVGIAWGQRAMAARPGRLDVLRTLDGPSFVVRGSDDGIASAEDAEAMAEALGVEAVQIAGAGHLAAMEAPARVAALVAGLASAAR